jgi:hypothetical protein
MFFAAALGLGLMACASAGLAQSAETPVRDLSMETAQAPDPAPAPAVAPAPLPDPAPTPALVAPPRPHAARIASHRPFRAYRASAPVRIHHFVDIACFGG